MRKPGVKQIIALMKEGYKGQCTSSGVQLVRMYTREKQEANLDLPRGETIKVSYTALNKLHDKGLITYDDELNFKENPYEDHHPIHFKLKGQDA